jgi:hypothetical protein
VLDILRDPKKSQQDKLRLVLIYYLSVDDVSKEDLSGFEEALTSAGASLEALNYVKTVRTFSKLAAASNIQQPPSSTSDFLGKFTSIGSKVDLAFFRLNSNCYLAGWTS